MKTKSRQPTLNTHMHVTRARVSRRYQRAGRSGNCSQCRLKTVHLAYRNLCDGCAKKSRLCPGCSKPPELAELADGEGAPEDDEETVSTDEEDLEGVVITHLSDNEDDV